MTIPQHIREEAEACYLHCEQMDSYGIIETIATALLAAEQRGMERAAEIVEASVIQNGGTEKYLLPRKDGNQDGLFYATAIRKARELLK